MTLEQASGILQAACQAEVEARHGRFVADGQTLKSIGKLAAALVADSPKFGIMLCGTCGNGKTTLLYAFRSALNLLSDAGAFGKPKGMAIIDALDVNRVATDLQEFRRLKATEMLAIEDLGREPAEVLSYGNALNPVIELLEYRYDRQLFTFITTNLTAAEIRSKYKQRVADRFNEMLEVIIFDNGSFRGKTQNKPI